MLSGVLWLVCARTINELHYPPDDRREGCEQGCTCRFLAYQEVRRRRFRLVGLSLEANKLQMPAFSEAIGVAHLARQSLDRRRVELFVFLISERRQCDASWY